MAVVISENPKFQNMFLGINRNWKTDQEQELGGQWAKQIQSYLDDKDFTECQWVIDLGGKSGTLYHRQGDIYVKRETIFADTPPNSLEILLQNLLTAQYQIANPALVLMSGAILHG